MITPTQLADWVILNRGRGKAFVGYSYQRILDEICECANQGTMLCVTHRGNIVGIVCGSVDHFRKVFYTYDVLTIEKKVFHEMVKQFKLKYPGYSLEGARKHGKLIAYKDIDKMICLTK